MSKYTVGVFMGGVSIEREVSFNSGRTVCDYADSYLYNILPIFQADDKTLYKLPWHFLHRGKISDFQDRLALEATKITWDELKNTIDFAFIAMHGTYAEDGVLQGVLEVLGIPYLGSGILASALCNDKIKQRAFLKQCGIAVPRYIQIVPEEIKAIDSIIFLMQQQNISFPCVVKPHAQGSSLGVRIVHQPSDLADAVYHAATIDPCRVQSIIVEEKIVGMEFSMTVLTDYHTGELLPLPPTEIVTNSQEFFDYEQKYMPGRAEKYTPARCSSEGIELITETVMHVINALNITNFARIDGFLTHDNRIIIIDPNTLSGLEPASFLFCQAAKRGMTHAHVINHMIATQMKHINQTKASQDVLSDSIIQKMTIGVLLGGESHEREISLASGRNVVSKLSPYKYKVVPIFVSDVMELFELSHEQLVLSSTREIAASLKQANKINWSDLKERLDFAFIALHGGKGENGAVQAMLEMLSIPYNGSGVLTSALCMDKYKTKQFLEAHEFDIPKGIFILANEWRANVHVQVEKINEIFEFPLVVKPHDDGCSFFVQRVSTIQELIAGVELVFASGKVAVLIEEYIMATEITVGLLGNEVIQCLPPTQVMRSCDILSIEEKFLPGAGQNLTPAALQSAAISHIQTTVKRAYQLLNCRGYARIDCFYQDSVQSPTGFERTIILEVNTLPGLTPATCLFHQASEIGLKPMEFLENIIQLGMQEHGRTYVCLLPQEIEQSN